VGRDSPPGYPIVQARRRRVATVAPFDPTADTGMATEIIRVAEAGRAFVAQLQSETRCAPARGLPASLGR